LATQAWGAYWRGRFEASEAGWSEVIALARETDNVYRLHYGLSMLAASLAMEGRIAEAWPLLEEAKAFGSAYREGLLIEVESTINWLAGNFRASAGALEAAWNPEGLSLRRRQHLFYGAHAAAETGRLVEARGFLTDIRGALAGRPWMYAGEHGDWLEGLLARLDGDRAASLDLIHGATSGLLETGARPLAAFSLLALSEVAGEAGDAPRAVEAASHLETLARELDRDLYRGLAGIASAWAARVTGRSGKAAQAARVAVSVLSGLGYRCFHGQALYVLGRATAATDPVAAAQAFSEAAAVFDICGTVWRREEARRAKEARTGDDVSQTT
jgi:hypothetical protein